MSFRYVCPVVVRFRDCDPMGHVNNAVYLTYLEVARFAYWQDVADGRNAADAGVIMARAEIDYKAPATAWTGSRCERPLPDSAGRVSCSSTRSSISTGA